MVRHGSEVCPGVRGNTCASLEGRERERVRGYGLKYKGLINISIIREGKSIMERVEKKSIYRLFFIINQKFIYAHIYLVSIELLTIFLRAIRYILYDTFTNIKH